MYIRTGTSGYVTNILSVLLIQLVAGRSLSSVTPTELWRLSSLHIASSKGQWLLSGVRAHSTRGLAESWAMFKGLTKEDICAAASRASPHTVVRFYRLDVTAPGITHSMLVAGTGEHH